MRNPPERKLLASEKACKWRSSGILRAPDDGRATKTSLIAPETSIYASISQFYAAKFRALESSKRRVKRRSHGTDYYEQNTELLLKESKPQNHPNI